jgi:hypothetical protein
MKFFKSLNNFNNQFNNFGKLFKFSKKFLQEGQEYSPHIKKKLQDQFEKRSGKKSNAFISGLEKLNFTNPKNEDLAELVKRYTEFVSAREKKRMNFNRKDRWAQRELDDIMKNFDVKSSKFKDFSKLSQEANIYNVKEFHSVEEIYFYLSNLLKEGFLEDQISAALDVFLKEINFFNTDDLKNANFQKFVKQLSASTITFTDDSVIYKSAKFLDWFNINDKHSWYNLERIVTNRKDLMNPSIMLKTLDHFAHQNEGSMELYDLFQYLFWSGKFKDVKNSDFISLGYNMYLTKQGYSQFFFDFYSQLLPRISHSDDTFDLLKILQTFSEISDHYPDLFKKIEDILLSRYEQLEITEASVIACAYSIAGFGSDMLFEYLEKYFIKNFDKLKEDKQSLRELTRAYVVSSIGSDMFFDILRKEIKKNLDIFNITEKVYIVKCYHDRKVNDKELFQMLEKAIAADLKQPAEKILLEEICAVADCLCSCKIFTREFQKLFEVVMAQRMKDITASPKVSQFLYNCFFETGMCSVGLMNLLLRSVRI